MPSQVQATATLESGVRFEVRGGSGWTTQADYGPPVGTGRGFTGLELLLGSLAACSGTVVAGMLRRLGREDVRLEVAARGVRQEEHPTVLTEIEVEFTLSGPVEAATVERAVAAAEERLCPVWAMLRPGTPIRSIVRVVPPAATPPTGG